MTQNHKRRHLPVNRPCILIGLAVLFAGAAVYLFDRQADRIFFIQLFRIPTGYFQPHHGLMGPMADNLPSFCHVFSFILITSGILGRPARGALPICVIWVLIELTFEIGQKYQSPLPAISRQIFQQMPGLNPVKNYFLYGTYDSFDLAAVMLGAAAAFLVLTITKKGKTDET